VAAPSQAGLPGSALEHDEPTVSDTLASVEAAIRAGDLLNAYDLAHAEAERGAADRRLHYYEVLTAARLGLLDEAQRLYVLRELDREADIDCRALRARLLKDLAFRRQEPEPAALTAAADVYRDVAHSTGDSFPAVNAASLYLLAGRSAEARRLATDILSTANHFAENDYFAAVTRAEALLLLGRDGEAYDAAEHALRARGATAGARATTVTQLERLAPVLHAARALADLLRPEAIATFCGHIFRPDFAREQALAADVATIISTKKIGVGYGALAAGADLLIAEQLLARGGEVHGVLPFHEADFIKASVAPAGETWVRRYHEVRQQISSLTFATPSDYVGDPRQFAYGADVAMGLAGLRAAHARANVWQLAIWDGGPSGIAGTGRDVARWRSQGGQSIVIDGADLNRPRHAAQADGPDRREQKAVLFTDFPGFSALPERHLPAFWSEVMEAASAALERHAAELDYRNSWGDAIYAVFSSARSAAEAALDIQHALARIDASKLGLDRPAAMRISLHHGPLYVGRDPITGRQSYYGIEVSRAARVEPITPPGSVYVTEPFAAILWIEARDRFATRFVGTMPLPKGFGEFRIYALDHALA
jgi:class 3 adenylate cyclase